MSAKGMLTDAGRFAELGVDALTSALQDAHAERLNRRGLPLVLRELAATDRGDLQAWAGRLEASNSSAAFRLMPHVRSAASLDEVFEHPDSRAIARNYLGTLREADALEALKSVATVLPTTQRRVLLASGAMATEAQESMPTAITALQFSDEDLPPVRAVALVVGNTELFTAVDPELSRLFENELRTAVIASGNRLVLDSLPPGTVASGDGTPVGDLSAALSAAGDDSHFVVLAHRSFVRALALRSDGRMSVDGGTFSPGVVVIGIEPDSGTSRITAVPAGRCRIADYGFQVRHSGHATIDMSATPTSPAEQVSLFQVSARAVAVERVVRLFFSGAPGVVA